MIYGNSPKKDSSFDAKAKLAEEAKKISQQHVLAQKQQEKNRLQLQIDNRKRDLDRADGDLRSKEAKLIELKQKLDDARRSQFILKGQIKQREGTIGYLKDQNQSVEGQTAAGEAELEKVKLKEDGVVAEINKIKKEITEEEALLVSKMAENQKLEQEYKSLEVNAKQISGDKFKVIKTVEAKTAEKKKDEQDLLFRGRLVEELERDQQQISAEITRLNRDKSAKEQEVKDLEKKRDAISLL